MRIRPSSLSTGTALSGGGTLAAPVRLQPHPLNVLLFGKRPPRRLDPRRYPSLTKALRKLEYVKDEICEQLGEPAAAFSLGLAEGGNACISREGEILFGAELLERHGGDDDLLVAILGHEVGHRPDQWPQGQLKLTRAQLSQLYKEEEAKADRLAGRALAKLDADPESVCRFLLAAEKFEGGQPPVDYYPAEARARMIREAYQWQRERQLRRGGRRRLRKLR